MGIQSSYPQIVCNKNKLVHNISALLKACRTHHVELVGVTKLCAGNFELAKLFVEHGIKIIGDSRIANLATFESLPVKKMLLRIPMWSEVNELVKYCDVCLISEISTIQKINHAAAKNGRIIEIILMIETGDIREGLLDNQTIFRTVQEILTCKHVKLIGLGTNFACFGATVPETSKLIKLAELKSQLEDNFKIKLPTISAGNSSHITVWDDKEMPSTINQMRSGAAIFMGFGLNDEPIPFLEQHVFTLKAQIVEVQVKPSSS